MKKIQSFLLLLIALVIFQTVGKPQCYGVTVEAFPAEPQSGPYNYFGVRVTLVQTYNENITVNGYIYDEGDPNTNNPFSVTVYSGYLTGETAVTFYQTCPTCNAVVDITSISPCPQFPLLIMTSGLENYIGQQLSAIGTAGNNICSQVDDLTSDVTSDDGVLTFPDWVRFVQIGLAIDSLNAVWDSIYAAIMNNIVNYAFSTGAVMGDDNSANREAVWDIIEENYFIVAEDKASACMDAKFDFTSLQTYLNNEEDEWLENGNSDMSENPALLEDVPEEFRSLMGPGRSIVITDPDISNQLSGSQFDEETKKKFLEIIKEIVDILGALLNGLGQLVGLFEDCDGSTEAHVRHIRDGILFDNDNRMIGYEMEQRDVTFDFNHTVTKIKGKAKLFKKKSNGKFKKDKKNVVGITFCAKEWNGCDDEEWPADNNSYFHPLRTKLKKVKTWIRQPMALQITMSYHYVLFSFFGMNQYVDSKNLLGTSSCL